ncbi:MAG: tRNA lysidine(34) synthetase TilS [Ruminococcaceae bacterium]|nr:tRNA lysidine(34) synthetase TilS [Oscillospiraceae bacterium]
MILKKVLNTISSNSLLGEYKHIIVACSGGADSVALLHSLIELRDELNITVSAAHFNHLIRGAEAERDEEFVRELCRKYDITFFSGSGDVPAFAKQNAMSMELAARKLRYEFLNGLCEDALIATAHTASDNLETVLFNLVRGTGLDGLCGIPLKRGRFIRPLIDCTREEIEDYCKENGLVFVTDSSNLSDEYTRNRIRHLIVPKLKEINPAVEAAVGRCCKNLREERQSQLCVAERYFETALKNGMLSLEGFDELSCAVAKRVLRMYCDTCSLDAEALHLERLYGICKNGGKCSMPNNLSAVCKDGVLSFETQEKEKDVEFLTEITQENVDFSNCSQKIHNLLLNNSVDCDKIIGKPYFRTRLPGDTFKLRKGSGTKTLKKLFNEFKIPICERKNLPLLCDEKGIIWIYRIGAAGRVSLGHDTKKVIKINVKKQGV